jgi:glycosyltransferase involved in cell wall biosynthesis
VAANGYIREKLWKPLCERIFKRIVDDYWMQIGVLQHYDPRPTEWDKFPRPRLALKRLPQIGIVTPSFNQAPFIERTLLSILDQKYPKLLYAVQDGGSKDASPQIIASYADRLTRWESARDHGQADAVCKGFAQMASRLGPDDIMAWINSDDLVAPGALRYVAEYFARHPEVDIVYGHRIIIDAADHDIARWIMPRHEPRSLEWIDYVPQETLFWRKHAWDLVGGLDPSFQFALDWDLLARFTQAGLRAVRLPYFLGCFRVHHEQKTSQHIHSTGAEEMARVRTRFHGPERQSDMEMINTWARRIRFRGAITARLHALGIRW